MNYYAICLKKYAEFAGRARRKEYWMFVLVNFLIAIAISIGGGILGLEEGTAVISGLYSLAVLVPGIAVTVRRLHDTGRSGWWMLIALIPIAGPIAMLIFLCGVSKPGENEYGPNPCVNVIEGEAMADTIEQNRSTSESRNFAWRRFSARWVDWALGYATAVGICSGLGALRVPVNDTVIALIALICYFYFDAVQWLIFGNTLGKRIFGVAVCRTSGEKLGRLVYLWRSLAMTWFGLKFLVWPIVCIHQYIRVSHGREASYDDNLGYKVVSMRGKKWYDAIIPALLIALPLGAILLGALLPALRSVMSK